MFKIFQSQIEGFDAHVQPSRFRHKRYWAEGIKGLFDELAFSHFGLNQDLKIPRYELIRNRIRDHFTQIGMLLLVMLLNWHIIANLKPNLNWRSILNAFQTISYGKNWQLYASVHIIWKLSRGCHIDVPWENRICRLCSMGMVESEFHFLSVYPLYTGLRREFLTSTSWPSVSKFINIMSSNSNWFLMKLAKFISL